MVVTGPNWDWHPEGLPPSALPPQGEPEHTAPVDIETARHLWFGVVVLGLFGLVVGLFEVWSDRGAYVAQLVEQVKTQDPTLAVSADTADTVLIVALIMAAVIGVAVAGLFWLVVKKMRAGKMWGRAVLTFFGIIIVVTSIPTLFGLSSASGGTSVVVSVSAIVQAVLAAGAIVLMHRKDSTQYFLATRRKL